MNICTVAQIDLFLFILKVANIRCNILDLVAGEVKNFHTLSCENKLIFLMNNENISILNTVGKFFKDNLYQNFVLI
jgi:hypothetical protein